jgi:hypothetical protein
MTLNPFREDTDDGQRMLPMTKELRAAGPTFLGDLP